MLQALIDLIQERGLHNPRQLAKELGVSEAMVEAMLAHLVRMGVLAQCEPGSCTSCSPGGGCTPPAKRKIWVLNGDSKTGG